MANKYYRYVTADTDTLELEAPILAKLGEQLVDPASPIGAPLAGEFDAMVDAVISNPTGDARATLESLIGGGGAPVEFAYVSVLDHGAIADDATDCTAAFEAASAAAVAAGKPLFVPAGTYQVSDVDLAAGTTIFGVRRKSILKRIAGSSASVLDCGLGDINVTDLVLDGNAANVTATAGSALVFGDDTLVEHVRVRNCKTGGMRSSNKTRITVRNCHIESTGTIALYIEATSVDIEDIILENNIIDNSANAITWNDGNIKVHGVNGSYAVKRCRITNNTVRGPVGATSSAAINIEVWGNVANAIISQNTTFGGSMGISLDHSEGCTVASNNIRSHSYTGIEVAASGYVTVTGNNINGDGIATKGITSSNTSEKQLIVQGNSVAGCTSRGMSLLSSTDITVVGNHITQDAAYGLELRSATYATVVGNTIDGSVGATKGIWFDSCINVDVASNTVFGPTQHGIGFYATTAISMKVVATGNRISVAGGSKMASQFSGGAAYASDSVFMANDIGYLMVMPGVGPRLYMGTGNPENVQSAPPGSLYMRGDAVAGSSIYTKVSGTGNVGWEEISSTSRALSTTVTYNMTTAAATVADATVAVGGDITNHSLVTFAFTDPSTAYGQNVLTAAGDAASAAAATAQYFSFTVSGADGLIQIASVTLKAAKGGSSTPRGYRLTYVVDGGTEVEFEAGTTIAAQRPTFANKTHTLATPFGSSIEVRIYPYTPSNTSSLDFDDIVATVTRY